MLPRLPRWLVAAVCKPLDWFAWLLWGPGPIVPDVPDPEPGSAVVPFPERRVTVPGRALKLRLDDTEVVLAVAESRAPVDVALRLSPAAAAKLAQDLDALARMAGRTASGRTWPPVPSAQ